MSIEMYLGKSSTEKKPFLKVEAEIFSILCPTPIRWEPVKDSGPPHTVQFLAMRNLIASDLLCAIGN
jgi:hypothetical protein